MKMRSLYSYMTYVLLLLLAVSCQPDIPDDGYGSGDDVRTVGRVSSAEKRNVLLLYSAGFNSLSGYLTDDISDLWNGPMPGAGRNDDVLLIYSHKLASDYATPNPPVLYRLYENHAGETVSDTLVVYDVNARSASAQQLNNVLSYINEAYPAKYYGMIFSSHATGYLPAGYYGSPTDESFDWDMFCRFGHRDRTPRPVPYVEIERDPSLPAVKSVGQDLVGPLGSRVSYEMEIADFAEAIPMHMRYILFDACLMGGVEVAYELREKCDMVAFSPTEVLAQGYDYNTLTTHLLCDEPDVQAVCEDYYAQYESQSGSWQSATISLVDCRKLEGLAGLCENLFEKYRAGLALIDPERVQQYFTYSYHWFYDLESVVTESGKAERYHYESLDASTRNRIRKASAELEQLVRTLEDIEEELASLTPEDDRYEDLDAQLRKYQASLEEKESEVEELNSELDEITARLQSIMEGWEEQMAVLDKDVSDLRKRLDACIIYKAATEMFLNMFDIDVYSGLSMYLPCNGGPNLDRYYRTLAWNIRTGLVE